MAADLESLAEQLARVADGERGDRSRPPKKTAFLFGGVPEVGTGRGLYDAEPVARAALDRCERVFREECGVSLLEWLFESTGDAAPAGPASGAGWTEPAAVALGLALAALWESLGIRPDAVAGNGPSAIAAASAAGVLTEENAMRFAARRFARRGPATPEGMEEDLDGLEAAAPVLPLLDPATGAPLGARIPGPAVWSQASRIPVPVPMLLEEFAAAAVDTLVTVGPTTVGEDDLAAAFGETRPRVVPSPLTAMSTESAAFTAAAAAASEAG